MRQQHSTWRLYIVVLVAVTISTQPSSVHGNTREGSTDEDSRNITKIEPLEMFIPDENTSSENENFELINSNQMYSKISRNEFSSHISKYHIEGDLQFVKKRNDTVLNEDHTLSDINDRRNVLENNKVQSYSPSSYKLDNEIFDKYLQTRISSDYTPSSTFNNEDKLGNYSISFPSSYDALRSFDPSSSDPSSSILNSESFIEEPSSRPHEETASAPVRFSLLESMSSNKNSFKKSPSLSESITNRTHATLNNTRRNISNKHNSGNSNNERKNQFRRKETSRVHDFVPFPVRNNRVSSEQLAASITRRLFLSSSMRSAVNDRVTSKSPPNTSFVRAARKFLRPAERASSSSNGHYYTNYNNGTKSTSSVPLNAAERVAPENNRGRVKISPSDPAPDDNTKEHAQDGTGIVSTTHTTPSQMSSFIRNEFFNDTAFAEVDVKRRRMTNDGRATSQPSSSSSSSTSSFVSWPSSDSAAAALAIGTAMPLKTNKRLHPPQRLPENDQNDNGLLNSLSNNTFARVSFHSSENSFRSALNNNSQKNEPATTTSFPISGNVQTVKPTAESASRSRSIDVESQPTRVLSRSHTGSPARPSVVFTDKSQYGRRTLDDGAEMKKSTGRSPAFDHVSFPVATVNSSSIYFRDRFGTETFGSGGVSTFVSDTFGSVGRNNNRFSRQSDGETDEDIETCRQFQEGDPENKMFFSPGFPGNYTKNANCIRVLEAPKGFLLKLDFRDVFDLEPSVDCKYDFLEVRDGMHGYSKAFGNFCSTTVPPFPPVIISSDRYLWLRFHSDENIEYQGFKAIYEFVPRPTKTQPEFEMCQIDMDGYEGVLNSTLDIPEERYNLSRTHNISLDCMWKITVQKGWKIHLSLNEFKLDKPNECESNFVDVFSDRTDLLARDKNFCGSIADTVTSKNEVMYVRFFAETNALESQFVGVFTAFHERAPSGCEENEYDCEDNTCIHSGLRCNGRINCRYRWDEDNCKDNKESKMKEEHIIIIMVIFSLIVTGMCAAFIFKCIKKIMRDHRIIQEHLRQSRAERLDQISNKKKSSSKDDVKKSTISLIPPSGGGSAHVLQSKQTIIGGGVATVTSNATRRSRSNSTQSSSSQRFAAANSLNTRHLDNCYVPGGDLVPILLKSDTNIGTNTNNDVDLYNNHPTKSQDIILMPSNDGVCTGSTGENDDLNDLNGSGGLAVPEMCDSACQTRESLFDPKIFSHQTSMSDRSLSPISSQGHDNSSSIHGYPCHENFRKVHHCRRSSIKSQHDPHKFGWIVEHPSSHESSASHHTHHESSHPGQLTPYKSSNPHYRSLERQGSSFDQGGPEGFKSSTEGSISSHPPVSPPAKFSTFGYRNDHQKNPKYRAEVAIEVDQNRGVDWRSDANAQNTQDANVNKKVALNKPQQRPYSVETTKSAPDVIVTH